MMKMTTRARERTPQRPSWWWQSLIALFLVIAITAWQGRHLLSGGDMAPDVSVRNAGGEVVALGGTPGKVTVLYFFAPWCGVCRLSIGNLATVRDWLGAARIETRAIALDYESPAEAVQFVAEHAGEVPLLLADDATRAAYRISAYPTYYVLDKEGRIAHASVGYSTLVGLLARAILAL